jgi:hypothetical protein
VVDAQLLGREDQAAVHAPVRVAREDLLAPHAALPPHPPTPAARIVSPLPDSRRLLMGMAKKVFEENDEAAPAPHDVAPRLTTHALHALRMSRSREKILTNLEEMYREAFDRARATNDMQQMASLDFAYRREQLYFEILLDVRDAMEKRA